jgi:single-strand DNA-binding protein
VEGCQIKCWYAFAKKQDFFSFSDYCFDIKNEFMRGLNKVTLIGNLGKEPEFQMLEGNIAVAKFSLATTETFKDKNGQSHSQTEWHTIVLWRGLADLANQYLTKGSLVFVEGKLKTRSYDDKDGIKRYVTEIIAEELILLDKKTASDT